jgi:GNAT superfamily N-acetyltransferase
VLKARRIRAEERDRTLATVVDAFRGDPLVRWYFPDDACYDRSAAAFFGVLLDSRIAGGEVWVVDGLDAVSMWIPPGGNLVGPETVAAAYADVVSGLPDPAPDRITVADELVDALLPREPHWYLGVLACRPGCRGRGLGSLVSAPLLAAADRAGLPVALETSTTDNVDYYMRRGFAVVGVQRPRPTGGPLIRVMRREPVTTLS